MLRFQCHSLTGPRGMKLFNSLRGWIVSAATSLAPLPPPKVRPGSRGFPSFFTTTKPDPTSAIPRADRRLASADILSLRANSTDTRKSIHDYVMASHDLSAASWAYLPVGILSLRANTTDTSKTIHDWVMASPHLPAAACASVRVGIPSTYSAIARSAV